jgi:stage III sporulation protein AG
MKLRKLTAIILTLVMAMSLLSAFALADGDPTFRGDNIEAKAGETITYSVFIENNPGIAGYKVQVDISPEAFDLEALEERLSRSLSKIEGVGETEVVLTVSSLGREVLAQDESRRGEEWSQTTVILQGSDRQETTVTTEVLAPSFQGALVGCEGGGSAAVRLEVKRAISALTGLGADRITVCARQGGRT